MTHTIPPDEIPDDELEGIIMVSAIATINRIDNESTSIHLTSGKICTFRIPIAGFRNALRGDIAYISYRQGDYIT